MPELSKKTKRKIKSQAKKETKKAYKRLTPLSVVVIVSVFVLSVVLGVVAEKLITRKDEFVLLGNKSYEIEVGQEFTYTEEGFRIISFGKDLSDKVKIDTNMTKNLDGTYSIDTSVEGDYFIKYTVDSHKFGKIKRVRTFTVGVSNE